MNTDIKDYSPKIHAAKRFFENIPFNKVLGLEVVHLGSDHCEFTMSMKKDLVGNWVKGILHGGAISTALDVAGGAMAFIANWDYLESKNITDSELSRRLGRMGTIDMRVDFLRPGVGQQFKITANLLRVGSTVAVTRMDFYNEEDVLIAAATASYVCG